ncbi:MAG: hydrogen gas-evolving membrane-bound hydrogenase subunit E, partial [Myxococcota bacterium]
GGLTFVLGATLALAKTDLKQILAQTTVSSLGLLVMLLGLGTDKAVKAAMVYLLAHALFKGALFMVAGGVDHEAGTRELPKLRGLRRTMPITAVAAGLAAFSMAGLPPFTGFLAKEVAYAATLKAGWAITILSVFGNAFMMAAALAAGILPFFGEPTENAKTAHEGPVHLWLGAATLAALGLAAGIFNHFTGHDLLSPAASSVAGAPLELELHLWPGFVPPLFVSLATIALGAILYWQLERIRTVVGSVLSRLWTFDALYDRALDATFSAAAKLGRMAHTEVLRYAMHVLIILAATAMAVTALSFGPHFPMPAFESADFQVGGIAALALASAFVIVFFSSRLKAILAMGVLGLSVALTFMLFGGPDLAFTQLMVETLSVVVLALVLTHLPVDGQDPRRIGRMLADGVLALTLGAVTTLTLWAITAMPFDGSLSEYYSKKSYVEAHGKNIVNVILVDFRAVDTLGEIMVVMSTGVAVLALLRGVRRSPREEGST